MDFTVGVSIFLFTVAAVFLFVPGTLGLFSDGGQEAIVTSNRVASSLSEGLLGDPETPHVLNTTCTVAFFGGSSPAGCRYDGGNLTERIGINPLQHANVTLRRNLSRDSDGSDNLCWDAANSRLVEADHSDCATRLSAGSRAPRGFDSSVTSRRVVEFNETDVTLIVEIW